MTEEKNENNKAETGILELIYKARGYSGTEAAELASAAGRENRTGGDLSAPPLPGKKDSPAAQEAFVAVFERYKNMIHSLADKFSHGETDRDDAFQEGLLGLYKAVMLYDPDFSSFTTFAYICVERRMISAYRTSKRVPPSYSLSELEDEDETAPRFSAALWDDKENPETVFIDRENSEQAMKKIDEMLSPLENKVLGCFLQGFSYEKTAKYLSISVKSVDNALKRVRTKLKVLLKH